MTYDDFKPPRIKGIGPAAVRILMDLQKGINSDVGLTGDSHSAALNNLVKNGLVLREIRAKGMPAIYSITKEGVLYFENLHPRSDRSQIRCPARPDPRRS